MIANFRPGRRARRGFALVLVILLLGLLLVLTYALAALGKVDAQASATAIYRTQARQNARVALSLACGALQQAAGPDDRITGIAGLSGVPAGAGNSTRHWCGVWAAEGNLVGWLASGAAPTTASIESPEALALVAPGALGADAADKEHVRAGLLPVQGDGAGAPRGRLAWWVGDEGVKLSAVITVEEEMVPGGRHGLDELIPALDPTAGALARVETYEQLAFVPASPLTPGQLQANFHALGRRHRVVVSAGAPRLAGGGLNVNSTSARYWRGVAATFNRLRPPGEQLGFSPTTFGQRMRDGFVGAAGPGKAAGGPFVQVDAFLGSDLLAAALQGSGVSPEQFGETMRPWLTVRSDTFRVRAYGDALNPAEPATVEAAAWCEAILQRSPEEIPGHGRRLVVTHFRWLGPDDT